jgi:hypothetical protein
MRARLVVFLGTGVGVHIAKAPRTWLSSRSLTRPNYFFKRYEMQLVIFKMLIDLHTHMIVAYGDERCTSFGP